MQKKNDGRLRTFKNEWDESYSRKENFIFYPKEECIKFLNRFVRKRVGIDKFVDIINLSSIARGLDYGCGIGRQAILMREFGIEAYGVDISQKAISTARRLAAHFGFADMGSKFSVVNGATVPFADDFFDLAICDSVLDSMEFVTAKKVIGEIGRVTSRIAFISMISGRAGKGGRISAREEIVNTPHEKGTIQNYYNMEKIHRLLDGTRFRIKWLNRIEEQLMLSNVRSARFHLVIEKV